MNMPIQESKPNASSRKACALLAAICAFALAAEAGGQTLTYNTQSYGNSSVDASLDGLTVADHWFTKDYNGPVGELALIFDGNISASVTGTPNGTFRGDAGGAYAGLLGMYAFCVDSDTSFLSSNPASQRFALQAQTVSYADARYIAEGVSQYIPGSLYRAAYLVETFILGRHAGGNIDAAAMQVAIWEVLYDLTPDVTLNAGNYYVRTNVGSSTAQANAAQVRDLANSMLATAAAANWGGPNYDPGDRVLIWMDPTNALLFQSVITLNPFIPSLPVVPEPRSAALIGLGLIAFCRRNRAAEPFDPRI